MIGPASCNFILKGACSEEIEMVQDILNSYIEYDVTPGKAISIEALNEQSDTDNAVMFDLSVDGVLKMKQLSFLADRECKVIYEKKDRKRLIEQMVLMVSGMRSQDIDYVDMLSILEKTCKFICTDDSKGDLIPKVVSIVKEMNKDAQEKGVSDYSFLMQLCDCDLLFAGDIYNAIDDIENSDNFTIYGQVILYRTSAGYKGTGPKYGIASIFAPVL